MRLLAARRSGLLERLINQRDSHQSVKLWLKNDLSVAEVAQALIECAIVWKVTILFGLSFFDLNCQEE